MKRILLLVSALSVVVGCAKNRETNPESRELTYNMQAKSTYTGVGDTRDVFCGKVTAVSNSTDGGFIFSGYQSDMRCGYFDFTQDKLQFKSIQGPYKGRESAANTTPVLFQWPIKHIQIALREVDGKVTNQEVDDPRLIWNEKNSFKTDFGKPDISEEDTLVGASTCWPVKSRRVLDDKMKAEKGYIDFVVEVVYNRECLSPEAYYNGFQTYTVQYRYSFKKWEPSDYEPFAYEGELDPKMRKFGYFQSVKTELNPKDGRPFNIFFINRWNPNKEHTFYFTKGTPQEYRYMFYDIFEKTNQLFADSGLAIRFHLSENDGSDGEEIKELGDMRYSFINIVDTIDPSAPLGYGPSDADPFTGEIVAATLNIWSSSLKDYIRRIEKSSKRIPTKWEDSDLYGKMAELIQETPDQWSTQWSTSDERAKFFQFMTQYTTYGHPAYNNFAKNVNAPVEVIAEKSTNYSDTKNVGYVNALDQVAAASVNVKPVELSAKDMNWVNSVVPTSSGVTFNAPMMINFTSLEEKPLFNVLKQMHNGSPSTPDEGKLKEFSQKVSEYEKYVLDDISKNRRGHCAINMESALDGLQGLVIEGFTAEEIAHNIMYRTAIHEFGHNLNLRHNFYGSVDEANFPAPSVPKMKKDENGTLVPVLDENDKPVMWHAISSSVMDYLRLQDDYFTEKNWEPYDVAAIKYAYSGGKVDDKKLYLFCTDENTVSNAFCNRFDVGSTPSRIVYSFIDAYEDGYYTRNYRDGRAYWNTGAYFAGIFDTMKQLKEFLPMWRASFYETNMREQLKKQNYGKDETEQMIIEMNREIKKAIKVSLAFYQSVLQQSAADKPYRSEYDLGSAALQRLGIADDKLIAMYFMAGDDALYYNPNRVLLNSSYMTYMGEPEFAPLMDKILENIVTQRVDMEPWFISYGRQWYAQSAMNYSNRADQSLINKIKIKKYTAYELEQYFGYDLQDLTKNTKTANLITLTQSKDADFSVGEEVAVVRSNTNYYMFSKQQNPYAFDIYKNIKFNEEAGGSATEGQLDLQELYYIYNFFTTGTI